MAGPVTVTCPLCHVAFPVPTEVVGVDERRHLAYVRMDRAELYGHLRECAAKQGDVDAAGLVNGEPTKAVERPPLAQPHDVPPLPGGRRSCVMCGVLNAECMTRLQRSTKGCCPACENGNTHPAPQDTVPCAAWGAEQDG